MWTWFRAPFANRKYQLNQINYSYGADALHVCASVFVVHNSLRAMRCTLRLSEPDGRTDGRESRREERVASAQELILPPPLPSTNRFASRQSAAQRVAGSCAAAAAVGARGGRLSKSFRSRDSISSPLVPCRPAHRSFDRSFTCAASEAVELVASRLGSAPHAGFSRSLFFLSSPLSPSPSPVSRSF